MTSFTSASASTSASLSSSSILKSKLSPPSKYCINCALDLSMSENESSGPGLYSLTCNSRVRSPLSPPTVETIPIPHALSTIFNVTPKADDEASGIFGLSAKQNPFSDLSSLPICFTCYLVLSDLYRTYTEFSQLRKRNSYLADKLQELQLNSSKVSKSALYPRQNKNESSAKSAGTSFSRPQLSHSQKNNSNPHRDRDRNRNSCPAGGVGNINIFRENGSTSSLLESFQIEEENVEFNFIKAEPSQVFQNESNELESTDFFLEDQSDGDGDSDNFKFETPSNNEGYCSDADQDLDPLAMVTVTTNRHQNIIPQHSRVIRRRKRKPKLEGMMTYEDMVKSYIRPVKKSESQTVEAEDVSPDPPRIICKDRCGKDFANRKVMLRHCKEQHCEVRPFSCDICHKRFARASHLRIHNFKVHFRDKYTDVTFERHC